MGCVGFPTESRNDWRNPGGCDDANEKRLIFSRGSIIRGETVVRWGCVFIGLLLASGCAVVDQGVSNPIPGLSKVAIAPFFNLSTEPAADGHRFAEAYFTELQKVPGFQVLPIGVTEAAMRDHQLDLQNTDDVIKLGQLLGVDAVVVGAITDYNPYYPPRVGLQVSWYSAHPWEFVPGIPTEPLARKSILLAEECPEDDPPDERFWEKCFSWCKQRGRNIYAEQSTVFRGQSEATFPPRPDLNDGKMLPPEPAPPRRLIVPEAQITPPILDTPSVVPREPLMAYTRLFDGSDSELTASLRDYVELRDDLRSGGWKASLHRTEDFLRFTAHRMIVEMLALHGGETRRRVVFLKRRQR